MRYLLKNCTIVHASSEEYHLKKHDILIENGVIKQIGIGIKIDDAEIIESPNLHCSIGWMDIGAHLGEPGNEQRETLESLCLSAKAGGYTDIAVFPNASPTIETKSQIQALKHAGKQHGVNIHPMAPLSHDTKGENIAEYIDLHAGGAIAYSDGLQSISKSGLLIRALNYAQATGAPVLHHPSDCSMAEGHNIHEGEVSISMGMKGSPSLAETMVVDRDIRLSDYTGAPIVIHAISCTESVDLIKRSQQNDSKLRTTVPYLNLIKTHNDLQDFDVNLKVDPPLRSEADKKALLDGINADVIDCIVSNHSPLEGEQKLVEYPYAEAGATGLETCFAALCTHASESLSLEKIIEKLTIGPRVTMDLDIPQIVVDSVCPITVFDPSIEWVYDRKNIQSLSQNSPFIDSTFTGKAICTIA